MQLTPRLVGSRLRVDGCGVLRAQVQGRAADPKS